MSATCGRGWAARCARAKGPRCTCSCGGENHGNPTARKRQGDLFMDPKLTNYHVFERDPAKSYDHFLPGADGIKDIHLARTPVGGLRDPSGERIGDALVDIEHRYVYHSPDGFEWGYGGSGPSELALNIMGLFLEAPEAWRLHQHYKWAVISRIPKEGGTILAADVRRWIETFWHEEKQTDNA